MKKLPDVKNNWFPLAEIISGYIRSKIFISAIRLKIFDHLDGKNAGEIAAALNAHPRNTELFLNTLVGMDIIRKHKGKYSHSELSAEFLDSKSPVYLGEYLNFFSSFNEQFNLKYEDLVLEGPPPQMNFDMSDDSIWAKSAKLAAAYIYSGPAQYIAEIISQLPEFPKMKNMLDLGGGSGFYTIAAVMAHPDMTGTIFEQPAVAEVAWEFVKEYGLEDRISIIKGDYNQDDLQGPYDLIFASATLNFIKNDMDPLFTKVYNSLAPGGIFMTHQDGIREERTKPLNHISEYLVPELMGSDFAILQGMIAETMIKNGFQSVRSFSKKSCMGEMEIDIGRKAL